MQRLTIALKGADDVQRAAVHLAVAGFDGPSVDHNGGPVEAGHRDDTTGHVLVTPREGHVSIIPML